VVYVRQATTAAWMINCLVALHLMNITFCANSVHLSVRPDYGYSLRPARMNYMSHIQITA